MQTKNKIWISPLILMGILLLLTNSCEKAENSTIPVLATTIISNITQTSATSGGNITDDGGASVTARGVCWSTNQTPTVLDKKTTDGTGIGSFVSSITGLTANTVYYIRAYATNSTGTGYGNTVSFRTEQIIVGPVTDIDGNIYQTVTIGTQIWMKKNLKVTHYNNGDAIPNITDNTEWGNLTNGAYCNYLNMTDLVNTYGRLYNWDAINDSRKICPNGWHIPSVEEWETLIEFLGGDNIAGGKMKLDGTTYWNSPNSGATNESGFSAIPAGLRRQDGDFIFISDYAYFWSSTYYSDGNAYYKTLYYSSSKIGGGNWGVSGYGLSVRCIMD